MPPGLFKPDQPVTFSIRRHRKKEHISLWMGVTVAALTIIALVWVAKQSNWSPDNFKSLLLFNVADEQMFVPKADLISLEQARERYRQSIKALEETQYEAAMAGFKSLESVCPGLIDLILLHEAEIYAAQGNEWAAQKKLTELIKDHGASPTMGLATYRLGQSHFRGSEWDKARAQFQAVRSNFAQTPYALGSLYYLSQLELKAAMPQTKTQAIALGMEYLRQCGDCRFSGELADQLGKLITTPTAEQHALLGKGYVSGGRNWKASLHHLSNAPFEAVWFELAKAQKQNNQIPAAVKTYSDGLAFATDMDRVRTAVDAIINNTPASQRLTRLQQLSAKQLKLGGDYVLWKMAQLDAANAQTYYQVIVTRYPNGDYAPESGWSFLWPLLKSGQYTTFVEKGQQYLSQYSYAKAAPKVLFWIGKILEASAPAEATQAYQRILAQYPTSYYAFRASGRLKVLTEGKRDPGWETDRMGLNYPPANHSLLALDILPPAERFASNVNEGQKRRGVAEELKAIGAGDDLELFTTETLGSVPPQVESWALHVAGDRPRAIRVIRDALDNKDNPNRPRTTPDGKPIPPYVSVKDEMKLLYPIYFEQDITHFSQKNRLDPLIVQSLMREESYFNEFAVSSSNALGLMQLLPTTAGEVAQWEKLSGFQSNALFLPATNIQLGSRYLGYLHETFGGDSMRAVGSYNGGPNAMKRWVTASPYFASDRDMFVESIPYEQTRDYIKKVFGSYWNYRRLYANEPIAR